MKKLILEIFFKNKKTFLLVEKGLLVNRKNYLP